MSETETETDTDKVFYVLLFRKGFFPTFMGPLDEREARRNLYHDPEKERRVLVRRA